MTGSKFDYKKHCTLQFGTYVQLHEPQNNFLMLRTSGAITIQPMYNAHASYYFLNMHSGKSIVRHRWTIVPILAEVIATVHQLAAACKIYKGIDDTDETGDIEDEIMAITGVHEDNTPEIAGLHENYTWTTILTKYQ